MSSQHARVAIVDDDASVRKALSLLLDVYSYEVETYGSAAEFLQSLRKGVPQCLIVDLQMPEMTGLELQHRLACDGFNIPTIVITGHDEVAAQERCRSAGAKAYLHKPIQEDTLIAAIGAATA
ncbi:response regulator [Bradyrhizobium sp. SRL28]|uniref:response regulator transcription factor n=1 Tax=Bradyrhizobium sp. SRL28 TaxID=2836178 RepID=UPI001BDDE814|nr:response regulator [Bradyrhizobium sp. SRL28]MBT1514453.1 response regulator [Bradyrhizobium sp. SRL28]